MAKHGLSMLSLHFKPMLLEDVANSRDFIVIPPMPYGQRASSNISCFDCKYKQKSAYKNALKQKILKYFLIFFGGFRKTLYLCNQLIDKSNTRESDNPYQVHFKI